MRKFTWEKRTLTIAPWKIVQPFFTYRFDLKANGKIPMEYIKARPRLKAAFPTSVMLTDPKVVLVYQHRTALQVIPCAYNGTFENLSHCETSLVFENTLLMFKGNVNNSQRWMKC